MSQHLSKMEILTVSLVDAGANARRFAVLKRQEPIVAKYPSLLGNVTISTPSTVSNNGGPVSWSTVDKVVTKTEGGKAFEAGDYAYVPDPKSPSTWKLRLTDTPGGDPDARIVGAAIAALGKGFRGQKVDIPDEDRPAVEAKVRAAWKKANGDKEPSEMPAAVAKADPVDTLRDTLWQAMVAKGKDGKPIPLVQKRVLFTKAIERFRETDVAKVGRPISAARLAQLKDVHSILGDLIAGAEPKDGRPEGDWWAAPVAKENSMTPEELVEAVKPLIAEAVTAAMPQPVEVTLEQTTEDVTLAEVVEAVGKMAERLEAVEAAVTKSHSQALPGQDGVAKSQSKFAGIL